MEQNKNVAGPDSATERTGIPDHRSPDRPAPPAAPDPPDLAEPLIVEPLIADTLAETFPPGSRKPRHDGWTP